MNKNQVIRLNQDQDMALDGLNPAQRAIINQQTPAHLIRERIGKGGKKFSYVPHNYVTELLNVAFSHAWSFETDVISQLTNEREITVKGRLIVHGMAGREIVKEQYGSQEIPIGKSGPGMSLGDALKGAGSDALRKCASLLGIALDLYGEQVGPVVVPDPPIDPKTEKSIRAVIRSHVFTDDERRKAEAFLSRKPLQDTAERFLESLRTHERERKQAKKQAETAEKPPETVQNADFEAKNGQNTEKTGKKLYKQGSSVPDPGLPADPLELYERGQNKLMAAQYSDDRSRWQSESAEAKKLIAQAERIYREQGWALICSECQTESVKIQDRQTWQMVGDGNCQQWICPNCWTANQSDQGETVTEADQAAIDAPESDPMSEDQENQIRKKCAYFYMSGEDQKSLYRYAEQEITVFPPRSGQWAEQVIRDFQPIYTAWKALSPGRRP